MWVWSPYGSRHILNSGPRRSAIATQTTKLPTLLENKTRRHLSNSEGHLKAWLGLLRRPFREVGPWRFLDSRWNSFLAEVKQNAIWRPDSLIRTFWRYLPGMSVVRYFSSRVRISVSGSSSSWILMAIQYSSASPHMVCCASVRCWGPRILLVLDLSHTYLFTLMIAVDVPTKARLTHIGTLFQPPLILQRSSTYTPSQILVDPAWPKRKPRFRRPKTCWVGMLSKYLWLSCKSCCLPQFYHCSSDTT